MTTDNWIAIAAIVVSVSGGVAAIIISILKGYVRSEIKAAIGSLKEAEMERLRADIIRKEDKIELLKGAVRDLK